MKEAKENISSLGLRVGWHLPISVIIKTLRGRVSDPPLQLQYESADLFSVRSPANHDGAARITMPALRSRPCPLLLVGKLANETHAIA